MKILIVDDDPGTLNALRIGLISFGYNIIAVESGKAALEEIKNMEGSTDSINLLVTDFRMPEMDGLELIKKAKKLEQVEQKRTNSLDSGALKIFCLMSIDIGI